MPGPRELPVLSRAEVRELDRRAIEDYGLPGVVLMENAAAGAARWMLDRHGPGRRVIIACGGGNNGGDGYALARHLSNAGWEVQLLACVAPDALAGDAAVMARVARAMHLACSRFDGELRATLAAPELIVDALLGTGFRAPLRPEIAAAIEALNALRRARAEALIALDLPSGLDADSGLASVPCIRADATLSFAALKPGLLAPRAREQVGELVCIDIGAPRAILEALLAERRA